MGKSKQAKEKKFDRTVEISAPILDPEIIKAIHSPPRGQRLDLKHGGFKALLSDLNSQDSTDEMSPLNENHVPSYIGISCAVSGYSNYSSYAKRPLTSSPISKSELGNVSDNNNGKELAGERARTVSPTARRNQHAEHNQHVHHITIDKNNIQSPDEERKELTEKLVASATEHRRSPSPITPTEDDRHHGTYVGARYCPLPPPSKVVNKHIPLLGIDDDQDPDEHVDDQVNKVEQKIANLYGDEFVEGWRESMTHKTKKELPEDKNGGEQQAAVKPKDLVTLKPTPVQTKKPEEDNSQLLADIPTPNAKVLAGVEKQFLNRLLTDENPPMPSPPPHSPPPPGREIKTPTRPETPNPIEAPTKPESPISEKPTSPTPQPSLEPFQVEEEIHQSAPDATTEVLSPSGEEHIEYEIRAQSPVDNQASPVRIRSQPEAKADQQQQPHDECAGDQNLVSFTPEPAVTEEALKPTEESQAQPQVSTESEINDGRYYMNLLEQEKSFIMSQVTEAEAILAAQESELDEDITGRIRSAIGKANLLVNKKCNQFKGLCESNINANANEQYATLNDDLAGFWDMIRIQIEDVRRSFEDIWIAKANNWNIVKPTGEKPLTDSGDDESKEAKDKVNKPKLSAQKDQERRERLKEHINQMKQNQAAKTEETTTLIGDHEEADLEQIGCDVIETIVPDASEIISTKLEETTADEADDQLFSLMGSSSPPPPPHSPTEEQGGVDATENVAEKGSEKLLDLLD